MSLTVRGRQATTPVSGPSAPVTAAALLAILLLDALLTGWNLGYVGLSPYYAAAAKSMAADPRALLLGTLDPAASSTLDKLAGFAVPQAVAVALLGFHPWALALPQVLEGLVTLVAGFVIGLRWRGRATGLAMAALLAVTPLLAAMWGRPTEDAMTTMCQVLAFAALQRSIRTERLRWLIVSALLVAFGFQSKMMQSWLLLPALAVAALLGSRAPLRTRVLHVAAAGCICVIASVAWMTAIQLVPSPGRPFVDGTTDDSMFSMVFGYNGFDRLLPGLVPGAVPQLHASATIGHAVVNRTRTGVAGGSLLKLLMPQLSSQIGWLLPVALAGIMRSAVAIARRTRAGPGAGGGALPWPARVTAATEAGLAVWLVTTVAVLSVAFVPHATYFGVIALPITAFAVHGAAGAIAAYRSDRGWAILPALVGVQAAWAASILAFATAQLRPLLATVLVAGAVSVVALVLARRRGGRRIRTVGLATGLVAALLGPLVWSSFTVGSGGGGSASDAYAGPPIGSDATVPLIAVGRGPGLIVVHRPFSVPPAPRLSPADARLLRTVAARNAPGAIPFASDSMGIVVDVILRSRVSPLPMGGFSRRAPEPALGTLESLVRSGRLRFVLLQQDAAPASNAVLAADRAWVGRRCRFVLSGRFQDRSAQRQDLYDCALP